MFRSDARIRQEDDSLNTINLLNVDILLTIEKELSDSPYDMISLVFLLYDVPHTAFQQLYVYQQRSQNAGYKYTKDMNLLHQWWQYSKLKSTWKHEFVEALLICQLYGIVRKLDLDVTAAKKHYQSDNISACMYVNPLKKALYKLCENIHSENLDKLKQALVTFKIDTTEFESCELVLLKLMCEKFITMKDYMYDHKVYGYEFNADKLVNIVKCLPGLQQVSVKLEELQNSINCEQTRAPTYTTADDKLVAKPNNDNNCNEYDDLFEMINNLPVENIHLKTDTKAYHSEAYKIINPKKIGVCMIINQENFYPSKESIEKGDVLSDRKGSLVDERRLFNTMTSLNFEVYRMSNKNHDDMIAEIKSVVQEHVNAETSIIMMCILSHGVQDHVYTADSVKVKVSDIQSMLDSNEKTRGIPKVFIIQACQVADTPNGTFVADGPVPQSRFYVPQSDFLVYWATAAQYEAYRNEKKGSIFIYCLCDTIIRYYKTEPVNDIFTRVTDRVAGLCEALRLAQVPEFKTTLRKKLYFTLPQ